MSFEKTYSYENFALILEAPHRPVISPIALMNPVTFLNLSFLRHDIDLSPGSSL